MIDGHKQEYKFRRPYLGPNRKYLLGQLGFELEGLIDAPRTRAILTHQGKTPFIYNGLVFSKEVLFDYYELRKLAPNIDDEIRSVYSSFNPETLPTLEVISNITLQRSLVDNHALRYAYHGPDRDAHLRYLAVGLIGRRDTPEDSKAMISRRETPVHHNGSIYALWALLDYHKLMDGNPKTGADIQTLSPTFNPEALPPLEVIADSFLKRKF